MASLSALPAQLRPWLLCATLIAHVPGALAQNAGLVCNWQCYHVAANSAGHDLDELLARLGRLRFNGTRLTPQSLATLKAPKLRELVDKMPPDATFALLLSVGKTRNDAEAERRAKALVKSLEEGLQSAGLANRIHVVIQIQ